MAGMPYVGASAGSNVAGPTILTTNDWNVVGLDRFDALVRAASGAAAKERAERLREALALFRGRPLAVHVFDVVRGRAEEVGHDLRVMMPWIDQGFKDTK